MKSLLATLLSIAAFLTPLSALASTQILMGRSTNAAPTAATKWLVFNNATMVTSGATVGTTTNGAMPIPGTLSKLYAYVDTAPGSAQSWVVTMDIGGSLKTLTCVIPSDQTSCSDTVHSDAVNASQLVSLKFAATSSPLATQVHATVQLAPTTPNQTAWFTNSNTQGLSTTLEQYVPPGSYVNLNTSETVQTTIVPEGGTFQNMYAALGSALASGSEIFTPKNFSAGATSTITCTVSVSFCNDVSNTYATSSPAAGVIGDRMDMTIQPVTPNVGKTYGGSIGFTPTTAGDFVLPAYFGNDSNANAERYISPVGNNINAVEASSTMYADAMTITDMQVYVNTAPAAGKTRQYVIRQTTAGVTSTTTTTCTVNGSATPNNACRWSGSLTVAQGDGLSVADLPTGTPNATTGNISFIASVPAAASTTFLLRVLLNAKVFLNSFVFIN